MELNDVMRTTFAAREFTLFESHLGRNGPVYTPIADFPLAGDAESAVSSDP